MSDTEQTVNTAECVEIVRALVGAFEAKGQRLERHLHNEFEPETFLTPYQFTIQSELIERGMKALGMPTPEAPKPRKIPSKPTPVQAETLSTLASSPDAVLREHVGMGIGDSSYSVAACEVGSGEYISEKTFDCLRRYKWITRTREGRWRVQIGLYKLTDAGREALTRYQVKAGVV